MKIALLPVSTIITYHIKLLRTRDQQTQRHVFSPSSRRYTKNQPASYPTNLPPPVSLPPNIQ